MAEQPLVRSSGMFNMDGGLWLDILSSQGIGVTLPGAARRFENVNTFEALITGGTVWRVSFFDGPGIKKLADTRFGFKIVEAIWTDPRLVENPYTGSPLMGEPIGGNILDRKGVLKCLCNGKYLYVDPVTAGGPANQVQFAFVNNEQQATRFDNVAPVLGWLNDSVLGDGLIGYELEFFIFTKIRDTRVDINLEFFSGGPSGIRAAERRFVAFSKEKGLYLNINNVDLPPAQMQFQFTDNFNAGTRFQDLNVLIDILDETILGSETYGWAVPQFFFNGPPVAPTVNPFEQFWCVEENGPYLCIGTKQPTCEWLCNDAQQWENFRDFKNFVIQYLLNPRCYENRDEFELWWGQQDENAFYEWLLALYIKCSLQ